MQTPRPTDSGETPTQPRSSFTSLVALASCLALPCGAAAQESPEPVGDHSVATPPGIPAEPGPAPLTDVESRPPPTVTGPLGEDDVVRLARGQALGVRVATATERLAAARLRTSGLLPNPAITWDRETIETEPLAEIEDFFLLTLPIDVARPLTERSLAASESEWLLAEASMQRSKTVLEAVLAHHDLVFAKRRVAILEQAVRNLEEASRVLRQRELAGTASGYESARLTIAKDLAVSRHAEAQGQVTGARARLAALLGVDPRALEVRPELDLKALDRLTNAAKQATITRPAMKHAREAERHAVTARDRSAWTWVPVVEVAGGIKFTDALGGGTGYVLGVSVGVPLFDRGQALRAEADAQRKLSEARTDALERTITVDVAGTFAIYRAAREELARFEATTSNQVDVLLQAAVSGYREGERSIIELLDAQKTQIDVAERRLDLLGVAKRAEARLRAASGEFL